MFKTNTQSLQPLPKPVLNHAILGRHIHIYPISESDINSTYVSWLHDPETSKFIEGGGKENNLKSVREFIVSRRKKGLEVFVLKTSKDQKFIGTVSIINLDPLATAFGIMVGDPVARRIGLGGESYVLMMHYFFDKLGSYNLRNKVIVENDRACKTFETIGIERTSTLPDPVIIRDKSYHIGIYEISIDQWLSKRNSQFKRLLKSVEIVNL